MLQRESTVDMSIWGRIASSRTCRTLRTAAWLEWQSQGNWTNPWLFLLYLVAKPLTSALVLIFMYWVISGFSSHSGLFGFLIVGSAAWNFVEQLLTGLPIAVLDDREQYAMLKYVYIAPQSFVLFLIGRSVPRILAGFLSFVIILSFGTVLLGVPIDLRHVNYLLLVFALTFGFLAIGAMAIALAGLVLMMQRGAWTMPEAMTGALYVVAGVIFPLGILPGWVEKIALAVPLTYWVELVRRALLVGAVGASFPVASTLGVMGLLVLTTVMMMVIGVWVFRVCDRVARERGQIDRVTNY